MAAITANVSLHPDMAKRTAAWAKGAFTMDRVQADMLQTLKSIVNSTDGKRFPSFNVTVVTLEDQSTALEIEGTRLRRVTCDWLKGRHRKLAEALGVGWQVDEWYSDDSCQFKDTGYLKYVPL